MKLLVQFFQYGKVDARHGGVLMPADDSVGAIERNLTRMTDSELVTLQAQATEFAERCQVEYDARDRT